MTSATSSESYALAQEDQTRMRGMSISSLKNYTLTREVPIDNTTFTIESSAKFTNNTTGGDLAVQTVAPRSTTSRSPPR